jgi:predicted metal-dependent phosphotriesterase family hydrolase
MNFKENILANKIRTKLLIKIDSELKNKKSLILFPKKSENFAINYIEHFSSADLNNNNYNNKYYFSSDNLVIFRENSLNSLSTCVDSNYLTYFKKETLLEIQKKGIKILKKISTLLKKNKKIILNEKNYINSEKIIFNY